MATELKPVEKGYILQRNEEETQRLDKQHDLLLRTFGYDVHPSIADKLGPNAKVADLATGTAIWLQDLAKKLPSSVELHGFDITAQQYPNQAELSPNIALHIQNIKEPFAGEWHNKFDLVQVRFVSGGMGDKDWQITLANILQIVRPGGALQWIEPDYRTSLEGETGDDGTKPVAMETGCRQMLSASGLLGLKYVGAKLLPELFLEAGLQQIKTEIELPSDDLQLKREWGLNWIASTLQILEALSKAGTPGIGSMDDLRELRTAMFEEYRKGCLLHMEMDMVVGIKPR